MDWKDLTQPHETIVEMVSQNNPDLVIGILEGVDLASSSLTADAGSDTRTSGRLRVVGGGWVRNSFIRITVKYPGWSKVLGTYLVADDSASRESGQWVQDLELQSMLYALGQDKAASQWVVGAGASSLDAMAQMLDLCKRPHSIGGNGCSLSDNVAYESGTTYLERLYDLCAMGGDRLDVDGYGNVTVRPDVPASQRSAAFEIDLADQNGIAHDGLERSSDYLSAPGRVAVAYRWSESENGESVQREVTGAADSDGFSSASQRGYMVTDFRVLSELDPPTQAQAEAEARKALEELGGEHVTWQLSTMFLPVWENDTVDLTVPDGDERYTGKRHCLVKEAEVDLLHLTMRLTLEEA